MAGDQVVIAAEPRAEPNHQFCESCGIRAQLHHQECPRCRGPLVLRNTYSLAIASCRAVEARETRRRGRVPVLMATVAVIGAIGGVAYGIGRRQVAPPVEPVYLGRPHVGPRVATTPTDSEVEEAEASELTPVLSDEDSRRAQLGGDLESALAGYRRVLEQRPSDLNALVNTAQVLVRLNRAGEALPLLERAVELAPGSWMTQFNLARAYGQVEQWDRAVGHYQAASVLMPGHYPTLFNLGLALQRQNREPAAVDAFRRATETKDAGVDAWLALGIAQERSGQPDAARETYRRYLELAPDSPERARIEQRLNAPASVAPRGERPEPPQGLAGQ